MEYNTDYYGRFISLRHSDYATEMSVPRTTVPFPAKEQESRLRINILEDF